MDLSGHDTSPSPVCNMAFLPALGKPHNMAHIPPHMTPSCRARAGSAWNSLPVRPRVCREQSAPITPGGTKHVVFAITSKRHPQPSAMRRNGPARTRSLTNFVFQAVQKIAAARRKKRSEPTCGGIVSGAENMHYFRAPDHTHGPLKADRNGKTARARTLLLCTRDPRGLDRFAATPQRGLLGRPRTAHA